MGAPRIASTTPPTECPAWAKLAAHAEAAREASIAQLFAEDPRRAERFVARAPGLTLDFSRQRIGALGLRLLEQLAAERDFDAWRRALFAGAPVNLKTCSPAPLALLLSVLRPLSSTKTEA